MDKKLERAYQSVWGATDRSVNFDERQVVRGPMALEDVLTIEQLVESFAGVGIQASKLSEASSIIDDMLRWKFESFNDSNTGQHCRPGYEKRARTGCTIFLAYTSNMISSGVRDVIRSLVEHNLIDCIVTTAGGIEEDFIKCLENFAIGDFDIDGSMLRQQGVNRIGNILVKNTAYCKFQDWVVPLLDEMKEEKLSWRPSEIINRLGERINDQGSLYFWAHKNNIPVFCPALTDGSLGDILYFHSYRNAPGIEVNILPDQVQLNNLAVYAHRSGMIILGGGVSKHQVCNANLMRNGAELAVYINTGLELEASDSGAPPDEAVSWGKIKTGPNCRAVKVFCDATIAFPILACKCFGPVIRSTKLKRMQATARD